MTADRSRCRSLFKKKDETMHLPKKNYLPGVFHIVGGGGLPHPVAYLVSVISVFAVAAGSSTPRQAVAPSLFWPETSDVAHPRGLPEIGKWLISPDLTNAHWLGEKVEGKSLREPINVVIADSYSSTETEAVQRLLLFCDKASFKSRPGHSSGYFGWLGGRLFSQIPALKHHALSDEPFEFKNNHGRFFGPYRQGRTFYFIGALSREKLEPLTRSEHVYVSFNRARDALARALVEKAGFQRREPVRLNNAILDDRHFGTGDHDGLAVLLAAPERF